MSMKKILIYIVKKCLSPEKIASLIAGIIANLLRKASQTKNWDAIKDVIQKVEKCCKLFNEVYEDDELTEEDEAKIAQAIADLTDADSIKKILDKVDKIM